MKRRRHVVVSEQVYDLLRADSKKSSKPMFQIAGDIIVCYYSGNSEVNTASLGDKILTDVNTAAASKNREISSKTPFSAQNGENSAQSFPKGEGGFNLNCADSTVSTSDTINKVKLSKVNNEYLKNGLTSKEYWERVDGGSRPSWLPPEEYWCKIEEEFSFYWAPYPPIGRLDYETCKNIYRKIRDACDFPAPDIFLGVVLHFQNIWTNLVPNNPDYAPRFSKFLKEAEWRKISKAVILKIAGNREFYNKKMLELVGKYNGETNMPPQQNKQEPQKQAQEQPPPIPDDVPPAEEIMRMPIHEQMQLASDCGYGMPVSIFIDAVRLRDQSRNKTTQEEL
ncbi:hypothetical protein R83H12_00471 [Fibrobacteria bacterium R8-3-H12]